MSNTEVTCSRILMTGAFSRGLCQAMTAISVAGIIGAIGRIANAEPQTQRADTPAGGRWGAFEGGPEGMVGALAVFGEPGSPASHPVLYAGGRFTRAGGTRAKLIAKWDDGRWSPVGQGLDGESVEALTVFDEDGAGPGQPALYVAGSFNKAGGKKALNIARWDGTQWSAVGGGLDGMVIDLAVYDEDHDGPRPPALFAAGMFSRAGTNEASNIARWDGQEWVAVGKGRSRPVYALTVGDPDGSGPSKPGLVAGGMTSVDLWDGQQWFSFGRPGFRTFALTTFDHDGDGRPTLYAGGQIINRQSAATTTVARWNGTDWVPLADALNERVYALTVFDPDGEGPLRPALYAAGSFNKVGDRPAHGLASWDGLGWSILEGGPRSDPLTPRMNCLVVFDRDATGPQAAMLCVGGLFKLDGQNRSRNIAGWSLQPSPANGP